MKPVPVCEFVSDASGKGASACDDARVCCSGRLAASSAARASWVSLTGVLADGGDEDLGGGGMDIEELMIMEAIRLSLMDSQVSEATRFL